MNIWDRNIRAELKTATLAPEQLARIHTEADAAFPEFPELLARIFDSAGQQPLTRAQFTEHLDSFFRDQIDEIPCRYLNREGQHINMQEFLLDAFEDYAVLQAGKRLQRHIIDRMSLDDDSPESGKYKVSMDGQTGDLLDMLKGASDGDMKNEISLFKAQEFLRAYHRKSPQRGTPREIFLQTDTAAEYLDFLRDAAQDSGVTEVMERVIAGIAEKQEYQLLDKPMDMARMVYDRTIKGLAFAPAERFQQMVNQRLREASAQSGLPLPELS